MRRLSILGSGLLVAAAYFVLSALPAFSASGATVNAQVRALATEPCITLESSAIDFGSLPFSTFGAPSGGAASPPIAAHSCSSGEERLFVQGTDATTSNASAFWALSPDPLSTCDLGPNVYKLDADHGAGVTNVSTFSQEARLVGANEFLTLNHVIHMPCTPSDGAGQTMTMQIVYTTSF